MSYPIISADSHVTEPPNAYMLAEHTGALTAEQRRAILCKSVAELYRIDLAALAAPGSFAAAGMITPTAS